MTVQAAHLHVHRHATIRLMVARYAPSVILAGYGVFILSLLARGVMIWYINPSYVWPTTAAGVALIVLAGVRLVWRTEAHSCDGDACECEQSPTKWWPYAVLSLPLLLAALVPPHGLAAFSALQRGPQIAGMTAMTGTSTVTRVSLSVDTKSLSLQDWAGILSADPNPQDYAGKPLSITGMVLHNPAMVPPGTFMVIRYQVTCCIADAQPIGLVVRDTSHGALKDNQWVTVSGSMGITKFEGQKVAVVQPRSIVQIKAGNPYIY